MKFALYYSEDPSIVTIGLSVENRIEWPFQTRCLVKQAVESLELELGVTVLEDAAIVLTNNSGVAWRDVMLPILETIRDVLASGESLELAWGPTSYNRYLNTNDFQALPEKELSPLTESG